MASPSILISNEPTFVSCTFTKEHGPIIIHAKEKETEASFASASASASASPAAPSVDVDSNYHARNIIRSDVPDILSLSLIRIHALAAIIENDEHNCGDKDPEMIDVTPFEIRMFDKRYGDGDGDRATGTGTVPTRTGATDQQMQLLDIVSQMDVDGLSERLMDASMSAKIKLKGFANQNDDSNGNIDIDIDNDNDIDSGPTRTGTNGNGKEEQQELDSQGGGGELQNFLIRCDAIVQEFISAVHQQKQKMNRMRSNSGKSKSKRNRQGEGVGAGVGEGEGDSEMDMTMSFQNFTVNYFDALNRQCLHVDGILKEEEFANANTEREKNATNRIELNDELTQITIFYHDRSDRCHELIGSIPLTFPSNGPSWIYDLPIPFEPKWVRGNSTLLTVPTVSANDNAHGNGNGNDNANGAGAGGDTNNRMTRMLPSSGLSAVVQEFIDIISNYQTLWDDLDDIDSNAWVLEPSLPARRSCLERRLALRSGGLSLHIVLDVDHVHVRSVPLTARFIGSSDEMSGLRSAYQRYISLDEGASESMDMVVDANVDVDDIDMNIKGSNNDVNIGTLREKGEISCWSEQLSIRDNLERCFGFTLPSPATTEKTDYIVECGVCYAHRISIGDDDDDDDGSKTIIPDIVCSNTKCGRSYHQSCLSEWLHSIPGAKTSFGRIFGQCPYCCETISVKTTTGNNNL